MRRRRKNRERRIGHLPCSKRRRAGWEMLWEGSQKAFEIDWRGSTPLTTQANMCVCICATYSFSLFFSPSFSLLFFHIYKRRQKRPLVYVLRIIISSHSLSYSLSFFIFFSISLVENILQSHWFTHICETPKKKKKKNANMSNAYQRL